MLTDTFVFICWLSSAFVERKKNVVLSPRNNTRLDSFNTSTRRVGLIVPQIHSLYTSLDYGHWQLMSSTHWQGVRLFYSFTDYGLSFTDYPGIAFICFTIEIDSYESYQSSTNKHLHTCCVVLHVMSAFSKLHSLLIVCSFLPIQANENEVIAVQLTPQMTQLQQQPHIYHPSRWVIHFIWAISCSIVCIVMIHALTI